MDIVNHAVAGAAVGAAFGRPIVGALFGVLPDLVLGVKRLTLPTRAYNLTHSLLFSAVVGLVASVALGSPLPLLALLSHLLLDLPTHGSVWAPPLLYPFSDKRFSYGEEWEWFSPDWWVGFYITLVWSISWLFIARL
jgi:membrane-bound metal-dependent hydrolase YbcI (DUF457 family)